MSWRRQWVVLVPGDVAWVEKRTREILEEQENGSENHFLVSPGKGRYQAIVEKGREEIGSEFLLGEVFSRECDEPVYVIEGRADFDATYRFLKGKDSWIGKKPERLVRSLGCVPPWSEAPPLKLTKPTRTAALIQGLSTAQVIQALEKKVGRALPPGYYHFEESPKGLLLAEGTGWLGSKLTHLEFRFPRSTIYSVTAKPDLDYFSVFITHKKKTVEFVPPPEEASFYPAVHEVMGERTPEAILSALGMRKEWFRL